MSLNSLLTDGHFSLAGKIGLVADEAWHCKSCRHQLGDPSGDVFQGLRDKWANSLVLIAENVCLGCVHEWTKESTPFGTKKRSVRTVRDGSAPGIARSSC